jgi:ATPase subunit of ABC transporter with duplicated ATPase domains
MSDGPVYGDTSGAVLAVEGVSISAGERDIVTDVTWRVMQDERVGLVGPNGAGKSTLLSAIAGRRMLEGGRVLVKPGVTVGYLVQTAVSGSNLTAWEEAAAGMFRVRQAEDRLAAAQARCIADGPAAAPAAAEELAAAQYNFISVGGDTKELRIARVRRCRPARESGT